MPNLDDQAMLDQFKAEVSDRSEEIDPNEEHDWLSLTLGWAIAKGMSPEKANQFAINVRYGTNLA